MQFDRLQRREFITLLGGAAVAWPLGAHAQQAGKLPTIGYVGTNAADWAPRTSAFVGRLRELGWIEGRTLAIDYRWSEGRPERVAEFATEFVQKKVDVIVSYGTAVAAFKQATMVIPIIFAMASDPVGGGLVASLARPGGNVTGLSLQATDLAGKRLQRLREVVPAIRRLAIIFNGGYSATVLEMRDVQAAAQALGLEVAPLEVRRAEEIAPAFAGLKVKSDALYVAMDAFLEANRTQILALATGARLPTMFDNRIHVQAGALMSYGPSFQDLFRRAADDVDKILRGTKPGDIPVEQPTKFELVVNLKTAKAIGLTIPESFLSLADEVIE
jgi:putative ABC transport system substrate-binding protein